MMAAGTFGQNVRRMRVRRGIRQNVLSQLCGFSSNKVGKFERGILQPTLADAVALADYFEIGLDDLAGRGR
jgi:transcriptional regulator with XRE-family HTH domain